MRPLVCAESVIAIEAGTTTRLELRPELDAPPATTGTPAGAVVVTPQGLRVEGLTLAEIVSLVRSVG